jgi:hypothetical protein
MTTKKALIIIISVVAALILLVTLFVGAIAGFIFYTLGHSDAANEARSYLRNNAVLTHDIGEVSDFGFLVTGNLNSENSDGTASLGFKVIGEKKTVNATVDLVSRSGGQWRVIGARYVNDAGKTVELLNRFDSPDGANQLQE